MENQNSNQPKPDDKSLTLGLGLFLIVAGTLTMLEYFGIVPKDFKWGLPVVAVIWGIMLLVGYFSRKR